MAEEISIPPVDEVIARVAVANQAIDQINVGIQASNNEKAQAGTSAVRGQPQHILPQPIITDAQRTATLLQVVSGSLSK